MRAAADFKKTYVKLLVAGKKRISCGRFQTVRWRLPPLECRQLAVVFIDTPRLFDSHRSLLIDVGPTIGRQYDAYAAVSIFCSAQQVFANFWCMGILADMPPA